MAISAMIQKSKLQIQIHAKMIEQECPLIEKLLLINLEVCWIQVYGGFGQTQNEYIQGDYKRMDFL